MDFDTSRDKRIVAICDAINDDKSEFSLMPSNIEDKFRFDSSEPFALSLPPTTFIDCFAKATGYIRNSKSESAKLQLWHIPTNTGLSYEKARQIRNNGYVATPHLFD